MRNLVYVLPPTCFRATILRVRTFSLVEQVFLGTRRYGSSTLHSVLAMKTLGAPLTGR